jgi:hypothetical protein
MSMRVVSLRTACEVTDNEDISESKIMGALENAHIAI